MCVAKNRDGTDPNNWEIAGEKVSAGYEQTLNNITCILGTNPGNPWKVG